MADVCVTSPSEIARIRARERGPVYVAPTPEGNPRAGRKRKAKARKAAAKRVEQARRERAFARSQGR